MRRRILVTVASVALLLGACAMAVRYIEGSDKLLLRRSVKVADATGWSFYGRMFHVVKSPGAKSPDIYFTKETSTSGRTAPDLYLRKGFSGPETHLDVISRLVHSTRAPIGDAQFSDDFKQLLWTSRDGEAHIADLDGSHHVHWSVKNSARGRRREPNLLHWADDNKILELQCSKNTTYSQLIWRDAKTLKETWRAVLTRTSDLNINKLCLSDTNVDSKGFLYTYPMYSQGDTQYIDHWLFDLKANGKLLERNRITFPDNMTPERMMVDTEKNRVYWQSESSNVSSFAAIIQRYIPAFPADAQTTLSLSQSRCDGSGMHELGHVPAHGFDGGIDFMFCNGEKEQCIYFVYENALYRLPTD